MSLPLDVVKLEVRFPLPDGRALVQGPLSYNQDGLATQHSADFVREPRFAAAYAVGLENARPGVQVEWRVHVALWCAELGARLDGDFVECGVHTGILSGAAMAWLDFARLASRRFFLFDTWAGIPEEQMSAEEKRLGVPAMNRKYADGDATFAAVQRKFARWPNARVVRGRVPESLAAMADARSIAYLSIDMNVAAAEMAAIEQLWPRMARGAPLLLDDYGWAAHVNQKRAWDDWARRAGVMILALPTGQGLVLKP
ncbi:MAG TPA: TylF/MycF/NovP-related O-methyltransferase [Terriglobales bacterium]|nr:TylF/MycF/NovP-related O-methyltransferase [Terriglobales bacterium]